MRRWQTPLLLLFIILIIVSFINFKTLYKTQNNKLEEREHHKTPVPTYQPNHGNEENIKTQNDIKELIRLAKSSELKLDEQTNLIQEQAAKIDKIETGLQETRSSQNIETPNSTYKECAHVQIKDVPQIVERTNASKVPVEFYNLRFQNNYLDDFKFVHLESDVCSGVKNEKFIIFVVITDTTENAKATREVLRETWAGVKTHSDWTIRTVYLMGSTNDTHRMASIADESKKYGDIIQASCGDAYRDMSLKVMMALKWVEKYCANAKYVFRGTHDIVFHFGRFFEKINELSKITTESDNVFWGCPSTNMNIIHHGDKKFEKWAQDSPVVWESKQYPTYLGGSGFLMNLQAVRSVNRLYCRTPITWPDDTHMGAFIELLGVPPRGEKLYCQWIQFERLRPNVIIVHINQSKLKILLPMMEKVWKTLNN
ncbi:unnamed protein product [Owenia fusiformis]|uniref:Hexosyltransferase n=1 Tax=Owenia fusiformis TaxID=6347 RepID=A0A8J1YC75_OWEFU|nr:unnamed protein product [Owenia fusiformis]